MRETLSVSRGLTPLPRERHFGIADFLSISADGKENRKIRMSPSVPLSLSAQKLHLWFLGGGAPKMAAAGVASSGARTVLRLFVFHLRAGTPAQWKRRRESIPAGRNQTLRRETERGASRHSGCRETFPILLLGIIPGKKRQALYRKHPGKNFHGRNILSPIPSSFRG